MTTLKQYEEQSEAKCRHCGGKLGAIQRYPHTGGWDVEGFVVPQWLYRKCEKCGYDWNLLKLGVPR